MVLIVLSVFSGAVFASETAVEPSEVFLTEAQPLSASDQAFLKEALSLSALGSELARIAESGAGSAEMQSLGMTLRSEHTRSFAALRELARQKGVELDGDPLARHAGTLAGISTKRGADFDSAYLQQALKNHTAAVRLFGGAAQTSQDLDVRMLAERSLGDMKERLAEIGGEAVKLEGGIPASLPKPAKTPAPTLEKKRGKSAPPPPLDPAIAWAYRAKPAPAAGAAVPATRAPETKPFDARSMWRVPASVAGDSDPRPSPMVSGRGTVPAPAPRIVPRVGELSARAANPPVIIYRQVPASRTFRIFSRDY